MKSLEIFNRAVKESKGTNLIELANSEIQSIKQDLEVLEIIRKSHLGDDDFFIRFLIASYMDVDEYKKVKQWLEENEG